MKAEIIPRHIEMWLEALAGTKSHHDAIFTMIAELPDGPYRVVKDEAFHHRMKIWTPA